ncbi:SpoIIE family protein phosphatase [Streptomyces sp. RPA4-2]|uniref:SpoIIE family protein phosphatase n=1 Tax=Streptomyces sp. RPA4-2 TaxID=2721244 RepID=UPI002001DC5A|nr:SpoIIE family protein phosphatase [Streptomyces sp. RPA4-2]
MARTENTTPNDGPQNQGMYGSASAVLDERGAIVGWTQTAQRLLGYPARNVIGKSAAVLLPSTGEASAIADFAVRCRTQSEWSGHMRLRHQDGRELDVGLRISMLWGRDATFRWLVSATGVGEPSEEGAEGSLRESLVGRVPIGVVIRDTRLRCMWVNDTMESYDGIPRDRRLGRRFSDVLPGSQSEAFETLMRRVVRSGGSGVHDDRTLRPTSPGRDHHTVTTSYSCLQGADGQMLGVCSVTVDVTETQRARERFAVLSESSTRLGDTLDVVRTSQSVADLAVPLFADFAAVDLEQSVPFEAALPARTEPSGDRLPALRRAGLASINQGVPESPWARGEPIPLPPASPLSQALDNRRSHLEPVLNTGAGTWIDQDPVRARKIHENGMHSVMVVPMYARNVLLGLALFVRTQDPVPFEEADLLLAEQLVSRAALSLDRARQYARAHTATLALQRDLFPLPTTGNTAIEAAWRYLPADVEHGIGGDWFDVIELSGARVALVAGGAVGHGIDAAVAMGRLRTAVHTLADMEMPPDVLLCHLDDTVKRLATQHPRASTLMGATCLYAVYDPGTLRCTMAQAGHRPPAIIDLSGRVTFPDLHAGSPLGYGSGVPPDAVELELPEGSLMALYSDGLIATRDHNVDSGMRRLATVLAQPHQSLEEMCSQATDIFRRQESSADIALLLVRTHSLEPVNVACWTLPSDQSAVRSARRMAALQLTAWGLERLEDPTKLIVSELVTNALRHSSGPISLRLIQHEVLTCEVSDSGTGIPRLRRSDTADESGRGLFLVAQLSQRWGCRSTTSDKVVWAEMNLGSIPSNTRDSTEPATSDTPPDNRPE